MLRAAHNLVLDVDVSSSHEDLRTATWTTLDCKTCRLRRLRFVTVPGKRAGSTTGSALSCFGLGGRSRVFGLQHSRLQKLSILPSGIFSASASLRNLTNCYMRADYRRVHALRRHALSSRSSQSQSHQSSHDIHHTVRGRCPVKTRHARIASSLPRASKYTTTHTRQPEDPSRCAATHGQLLGRRLGRTRSQSTTRP